MPDLVIDGDGRIWTAGSRALQKHLGYPLPDFDLVDYAVRNFGWIHVRTHGAAMRLRVSLKPISQMAFLSTVKMMVGNPHDRYVFDLGPFEPSEIVSNLNDAVARLDDFRGDVEARWNAVVVSEELSLARLHHPKRRQLCDLVKEWERLHGRLAGDFLLPFQAAGVAGRTILTRIENNRTRIEYFGPRVDVYDADWPARAVGLDLEEQPDPAYGEGSAKGYRDVHQAGCPRLELVDALIQAPGRRPQHSRYERLLLPWKTAAGTNFVSGASLLRTRFSMGIAK